MGSRAKKKVRLLPQDIGDEDRISRLPDELLHKILSSFDAKVAVQTSVLSRRWKPVWTSLPFLTFGRYENSSPEIVSKFIRHVLSKRNHQSNVSELKICVKNEGFPRGLIDKFVAYAISHNVQSLSLELLDKHKPYKLSTFSSKSLQKLELRVYLQLESDCWDLPALTTLHLNRQYYTFKDSSSKNSLFPCLPALTSLCLEKWTLPPSSFCLISSPTITTLRLSHGSIFKTVLDFPALTSLELHDVSLPSNVSDIISALVNLKNLTLFIGSHHRHYFVSCPQVLNLSIRAGYYVDSYNIEVSGSKLCNFTSFSIFKATIRVSELENVNIRLQDWFNKVKLTDRKQVNERLINMLPGLGNAKNLTFDLDSIEALDEMSNLLLGLPSPFCKLKYVMLPRGFKESSMSSALRSFLLGASPKATIVSKLPRNDVNPRTMPVPLTPQHIDGKFIQAGGLVQGFGGPVQSISGAGNDSASSSRLNNDVGLWKGHEVNSEFVVLLDLIQKKYPETFERFTTKSKKFCTMKLNMLCTSVNVFTSTTMTEIDTEMITEYRTLFSDLQRSFDVKWLVSRLNYIEQLHLSQHELHAADSCIDEDFVTMGAKLAANASFIGNGLLSDS